MTLRIRYQYKKGEFEKAILSITEPMAEALTGAMTEIGQTIKQGARAQILAAGFSQRFANALRVEQFPARNQPAKGTKTKDRKPGQPLTSLRSALYIYHAAPFSEVFESGATLRGKPQMWVPMPGVPKTLGRKRLPPARFAKEIGPLFARRTRKGLALWAYMSVSKREAKAGPPYKIRISALRRGGQRVGSGVQVAVPVYSSVDNLKIRKRLSLRRLIATAAQDVPALYLKKLKVD